jgi:peptide/nickel transport system substrate-binding protein
VSRRALLGAGAGLAAAGTAGCAQRLADAVGASVPGQLSLTVKTVPADADAASTRIARRLVKHLEAVGVDAKVELQPARELYKDVLLAGEYDIYVGLSPERSDPDFLRPLLHSVFKGEPGWQNPFSFTDMAVDDLLTAQRRAGGETRKRLVNDLQRVTASKQPFGVVAIPNDVWAARTDRFRGWNNYSLTDPLSYIALEPTTEARETALRVTMTDPAATKNLNPLAVQHRSQSLYTGLLYDSLARRINGTATPWLAENWSWSPDVGPTHCTISLRPDLTWHDGEALTADDVAFTYRFLNDTLLSRGETPAPAPRFRGRASLVEDVTVIDDRTVRVRCPDTSPEVGSRVLSVPLLPEHIWRERAVETTAPWGDDGERVSEALQWPNNAPVGSGAVRFESRANGESLVLTRFDDHFLHRQPTTEIPDELAGGVAFERLSVRVVPSGHAAVQLLSADEADATTMRLAPDTVPRVGQDDSLELHVEDGDEFYHLGFNTQRPPLGNPHVRRAIVRLLDKQRVAQSMFDGYARPAVTPLAGTDWVPSDLIWDGTDPEVPFVGNDGELDEERARELFSDAGLEYGDDGRLLDQ